MWICKEIAAGSWLGVPAFPELTKSIPSSSFVQFRALLGTHLVSRHTKGPCNYIGVVGSMLEERRKKLSFYDNLNLDNPKHLGV
jgi:hypothetical protein